MFGFVPKKKSFQAKNNSCLNTKLFSYILDTAAARRNGKEPPLPFPPPLCVIQFCFAAPFCPSSVPYTSHRTHVALLIVFGAGVLQVPL